MRIGETVGLVVTLLVPVTAFSASSWGLGKATDLAGAVVAARKETKHDNAP